MEQETAGLVRRMAEGDSQAFDRLMEFYCASRSAAFHPKAVRGHFGNPALASR